ncbi:hypothetical protein BSPLISOX_2849 [uncultured Gammaproteobacteria bacterium]|jgi:type IV secretory pathway component VirB8|nr:hypothetical protein [uncultured Gammaproteobacteria bacterium]VVH62898.1 hypothetical protein BSPWISOX_2958 [uncultured Gammaproteobacteria bacterium]VVH64447.1 hypothetical protein BSPLISOX_2849 [uncultured Gammaproteobacteria bacterium]
MIALESYRQAVENNRLLQKVVIALIVLCVALSLAIATLFPLKETKYKLYEFSSSGQTFRLIDDASTLVKRTPILIKFLARQYVSYRETIDRKTEYDRFRIVQTESLNTVYEKFKQHYKKIDKELGDTGTRKITIELDNAFNNDWDKNIHIVEFSTEDTSETGQVVTNYWKAVIGYKFNRQKIRVDDIIQNPLGIEIIDYEIIKRNIMK